MATTYLMIALSLSNTSSPFLGNVKENSKNTNTNLKPKKQKKYWNNTPVEKKKFPKRFR